MDPRYKLYSDLLRETCKGGSYFCFILQHTFEVTLMYSYSVAQNLKKCSDSGRYRHQPKVTLATTSSQASSNYLTHSETHCLTGEEN